ncbi:transposase [Deinococcus petrolearius]|uniref:Transposase n=1 Tax=Deinococcus petrolearius TaxID=1751295 RepID=A0ABW1DKN8_9DEIO
MHGSVADRAYSGEKARQVCLKRGIRLEVPPKRNHKQPQSYDQVLYRRRNVVERLVGRLKRNRRIATRYEKRACYYTAMLTIALILEWLSPAC